MAEFDKKARIGLVGQWGLDQEMHTMPAAV